MTDRHRSLTVVLDEDYRGDDLEPIIQAIGRIRGVAIVTADRPVGSEDFVNRVVIKQELVQSLWDLLNPLATNQRPREPSGGAGGAAGGTDRDGEGASLHVRMR